MKQGAERQVKEVSSGSEVREAGSRGASFPLQGLVISPAEWPPGRGIGIIGAIMRSSCRPVREIREREREGKDVEEREKHQSKPDISDGQTSKGRRLEGLAYVCHQSIVLEILECHPRYHGTFTSNK